MTVSRRFLSRFSAMARNKVESIRRDRLIVLVVADETAAMIRRNDLRRLEPARREGRFAGARSRRSARPGRNRGSPACLNRRTSSRKHRHLGRRAVVGMVSPIAETRAIAVISFDLRRPVAKLRACPFETVIGMAEGAGGQIGEQSRYARHSASSRPRAWAAPRQTRHRRASAAGRGRDARSPRQGRRRRRRPSARRDR